MSDIRDLRVSGGIQLALSRTIYVLNQYELLLGVHCSDHVGDERDLDDACIWWVARFLDPPRNHFRVLIQVFSSPHSHRERLDLTFFERGEERLQFRFVQRKSFSQWTVSCPSDPQTSIFLQTYLPTEHERNLDVLDLSNLNEESNPVSPNIFFRIRLLVRRLCGR